MNAGKYHPALPMGDPYAEAEAELKANGRVLPERQPTNTTEKKRDPMIEEMRRIKVADVIYREDLYPRGEVDPALVDRYADVIDVLPPIELNQDNILIDGVHRLRAHQDKGLETITCTVTETASETELLQLACRRNASHGHQLSQTDKRRMAQNMYAAAGARGKELRLELADILSVPERTMRSWTQRIDRDDAVERRQKALDLWMSGHTVDEVAAAVDVSKGTVSNWTNNVFRFGKSAKSEQDRADFRDYTPPACNVWSGGESEEGDGHPGNDDRDILRNLLYAYTEPFDLVVAPFAGEGSAIDVCRERSRRYYVSDLKPIPARAHEIRQHDVTGGLPTPPRWSDVALAYLAPPCWKPAEGGCGDDGSYFANMDADAFHDELAKVVNGFADRMSEGARIALLIQPTQWKEAQHHRWVDHVVEIARRVDQPIINRVSCPLPAPEREPQVVVEDREDRTFLCLTRELIIWEVR